MEARQNDVLRGNAENRAENKWVDERRNEIACEKFGSNNADDVLLSDSDVRVCYLLFRHSFSISSMNLPNSRRLYILITDGEVLLFGEEDSLSSDLRPIDGREVLVSTFRTSFVTRGQAR